MPRLSDLLSAAAIDPIDPPLHDPWIVDAQLDSRAVAEGDLFFALRGERFDGESFVPQALERGARAIVAASPRPGSLRDGVAWVRIAEPRAAVGPIAREVHGRPDEALDLVGVTGTNGKTTVTYMLHAIAAAADLPAGLIGTTGSISPSASQPQARTTPEATDLFRTLDRMREEGARVVAMEVSSHALSLGRVRSARFRCAVFLNLSRDHLDYYEDEQAYFDAKARLFEMLDADARAVLPADSEWGRQLAGRTKARCATFGRSPQATVRLSDERCRIDGSSATLTAPEGAFAIETPLPGRFNLDNAAAAAAAALALGIAPDAIRRGLAALATVPGRVQRVVEGQPFEVWVDYAHTPDALDHVLSWARDAVEGRLLVVFGCGGDRDRGKRPEMGRVVATHADHCFVTSDNPRGEDPQRIVDDVVRGVEQVEGAAWTAIVDRRRAIEAAFDDARAGDLVVLAGKGHETTMTIGTDVLRFDDREVATRALRARYGAGDGHA